VDRTGWISPLIVSLTLVNDERIVIVFPGNLDDSNALLRHLRRNARQALIDNIPYPQFWGVTLPVAQASKPVDIPRVQLLRREDEAEVERLYQLLKTVGHLDTRQPDEK